MKAAALALLLLAAQQAAPPPPAASAEAVPLPSPPPAYADPSAFTEREVTVGSGEWALPGTLSMPNGPGPFPAVVLVHGSGPNDRDESIGPNKPFRDLAHGLASRGIAVLRYDKRSRVHGPKMASIPRATVKHEAIDDVVLAVAQLASMPAVALDRIFVAGHSLGGMLVPRIAAAVPIARGFIVLAGAARPLEQAILEQTHYIASLDGTISSEEQARIDEVKNNLDAVRALTEADAAAGRAIGGAPASYWLDLRGYDPPEAAKAVSRPMLILQGERDYQVTMKEFARWQAALDGRADVTFKSYPALNHQFMAGAGPGGPLEYGIPRHVEEQVVADMAAWMLQMPAPPRPTPRAEADPATPAVRPAPVSPLAAAAAAASVARGTPPEGPTSPAIEPGTGLPVQLTFAWPAGMTATIEAERTKTSTMGGDPVQTGSTVRYRMRVEPHRDGRSIVFDAFEPVPTMFPVAREIQMLETMAALVPGLIVKPDGTLLRVGDMSHVRAGMRGLVDRWKAETGATEVPSAVDIRMIELMSADALRQLATSEWERLVGPFAGFKGRIGLMAEIKSSHAAPSRADLRVPMRTTIGALRQTACAPGRAADSCVVMRARSSVTPQGAQMLMKEAMRELKDTEGIGQVTFDSLESESDLLITLEPSTMRPHRISVIDTQTVTITVAAAQMTLNMSEVERVTYRFTYR